MKKFGVYCHDARVITNRYTHEKIYASCGKCPACISLRHSRYVSLMETERKQHRYAFFCTLTYDDRFVPKLIYSDDKLFLYDLRHNVCIPNTFDLCNPVDAHWFIRKKYFEYSLYKDVQDFIKRIRQNYLRNVPFKQLKVKKYNFVLNKDHTYGFYRPVYETPRYYACSEYGPWTVRPHFHLILYFDSPWFAEHFGEMFYKSWSVFDRHSRRRVCKGVRSQFRAVEDDADAYTAAYCDALVGLPTLYKKSEIRPRHSYSRFPSLGAFDQSNETISQLFYTGALRRFTGLDKKGEPVPLYVPSSVSRSLFPRSPQFSVISDASRKFAYRLFRFALYDTGGDYSYGAIAESFYRNSGRIKNACPQLGTYVDNQMLETSSVKRPFYQLYLAGRRFFENMHRFGLSFNRYYGMLKDYWSLLEYYRLRDFYAFMEKFNEDIRYLYSTYVNVSNQFRSSYAFCKSSNFAEMVSITNKIGAQMTKSRKERDYQLRGNAVLYNPNQLLKF